MSQIILFLSVVIMFFATPCVAEEVAVNSAVPVILVSSKDADTAIDVGSVIKEIGAPVVPLKDLASRLGLLAPPDKEQVNAINALSEKAKNLFFGGEHKDAQDNFVDLVEQISSNPAFLAFEPSLRSTAFDALVFAAWSAAELNETDTMERMFTAAALDFPDLTPEPATFPPWIRKKLKAVKDGDAGTSGQIKINAPDSCEIYLNGRMLSSFTIDKVKGANTQISIFTRCFGHRSPVRSIAMDSSLKSISPLVLKHLEPDYSKDVFALTTTAKITELQIADDVATIAKLGGWGRAVVVLSQSQGEQLLLIETQTAKIVRRVNVISGDLVHVAEAARALSRESEPSASKVRWYKDGVAWTLLGSGLAVLGTGLVLSQVWERPSFTEPVAWALAAAGGGIAGTGLVLFFIPRSGKGVEQVLVGGTGFGLAGSWQF